MAWLRSIQIFLFASRNATRGAALRVAQTLNARIIQVRHRSHATYSRQPRQVRKEATVTGSCVCSGVPVPDLFAALRASDFPLGCYYFDFLFRRLQIFTRPLQVCTQEVLP